MISFIILAAGRGSRMNLDMQKCSLPIIDKVLIDYTLDAIRKK
ncbi:MAG: NTP transferase domain-containing protein [Clostridium sp.]|nr:MAG: NTP transferase domain-containing protein [Clostridium sp.]